MEQLLSTIPAHRTNFYHRSHQSRRQLILFFIPLDRGYPTAFSPHTNLEAELQTGFSITSAPEEAAF